MNLFDFERTYAISTNAKSHFWSVFVWNDFPRSTRPVWIIWGLWGSWNCAFWGSWNCPSIKFFYGTEKLLFSSERVFVWQIQLLIYQEAVVLFCKNIELHVGTKQIVQRELFKIVSQSARKNRTLGFISPDMIPLNPECNIFELTRFWIFSAANCIEYISDIHHEFKLMYSMI